VVAVVVIVIDESADLAFEVTGQVIVFQQDAVFQGLVPTLDLALGLGMIGAPRQDAELTERRYLDTREGQ
jgi:hypothetical protein